VIKEKNMYGRKVMGVVRTTFVIENGVIAKVFNNVKAEGHAAQVLEAV
jgi:peroxiredoxin Q/BCP